MFGVYLSSWQRNAEEGPEGGRRSSGPIVYFVYMGDTAKKMSRFAPVAVAELVIGNGCAVELRRFVEDVGP